MEYSFIIHRAEPFLVHDDAHNVFMALPRHTSTSEDEVPPDAKAAGNQSSTTEHNFFVEIQQKGELPCNN